MGFSSAWGAFKALSWFTKGASLPLISMIPGVGPIVGFLFGLVQLLWKLLMTTLAVLTRMFHDPKQVAALCVVVFFAIALGMHWGAAFTHWQVRNADANTREANLKMQTLVSQSENADAKDEALAEAAVTAGKAAEEIERERIADEAKVAHEAEARLGVAPLTLLDPPQSVAVADSPAVTGVRDVLAAPGKVRRRKQEPGMFESVSKSLGNAFDASKW